MSAPAHLRKARIEKIPELVRYFSNLSWHDVLDRTREIWLWLLFSFRTYTEMSFQQRKQALTCLEQDMAWHQKRRPVPVRVMDDPGLYGSYIPEKNLLQINRNSIDLVGMHGYHEITRMMPEGVIHVAHTIIHEGWHANQFTKALKDGEKTYREKEWRINILAGYLAGDDYPLYYTQPLERDANLYAAFMTSAIWETIQSFDGPEPPSVQKMLEKDYSLTGWKERLRAYLIQDRDPIRLCRKQMLQRYLTSGHEDPFTDEERKRWLDPKPGSETEVPH